MNEEEKEANGPKHLGPRFKTPLSDIGFKSHHGKAQRYTCFALHCGKSLLYALTNDKTL